MVLKHSVTRKLNHLPSQTVLSSFAMGAYRDAVVFDVLNLVVFTSSNMKHNGIECFNAASIDSIATPDSVVELCETCFYQCKNLRCLTLSHTEHINLSAFDKTSLDTLCILFIMSLTAWHQVVENLVPQSRSEYAILNLPLADVIQRPEHLLC